MGSMSVAVDDASVYSHGDSISHTISDLQGGGEDGVDDNDASSQRSDDAAEAARATRDASLGRDDDSSSMYPVTAGSVRSAPVEDESVDALASLSSLAGAASRFALPSTLLAGPLDVVGEEVGSAGASAGGSEGHTADHGGLSMAGSDDEEGEQGGEGGLQEADEDDEDGDGDLDEDEDCEDAVAGASVAVRPPRRRRAPRQATSGTSALSTRDIDQDTPPTFNEHGEGGVEEDDAGGDGDSAAAAARGARGVYRDDVRPEDHEEEGEDMGASDLKGGAFVTFAAETDVMGHPHELQGGGGDMGAADQPGRAFEDADSDGASDDSSSSQMDTEGGGGVSGLQDHQISLGTMGNRSDRHESGSVAGTSVGRVEGGSVLWADLVGTAEGAGQVDLSPLPDGMEEPAQAVASVRSGDGDGPSRDARSDGGGSQPRGGLGRRKGTGSPPVHRVGSAASDNSTVRSNLTGMTRDPRALGYSRAPVHSMPSARAHRIAEQMPFDREAHGLARHPVHSDVEDDDEDEDERHSFAAVASMGERAFTDQNHEGDSDSDSSSEQQRGHGQQRQRSKQRHTALGDTPLEAYDETKVLWRNHMSSNASTTALAEDGDADAPMHSSGMMQSAAQAQAQLRVPSTRGSPPKSAVQPPPSGSPLLALRNVLQLRSEVCPPVLPCTPNGEPNIWDADDTGSMDSAGAEVLAAALAASHAGAARPGSSTGGAASSTTDSTSRPSSAQSAPSKARIIGGGRGPAGTGAGAMGNGATMPARRPTSAVARSHHRATHGGGEVSNKVRVSGGVRTGTGRDRPASARPQPSSEAARPHSANASPKRRTKSRALRAEEDDFAVAHAVRAASRRPQASSRMQRLQHLVHAERTAAHRRAFDQEFDAEIPEMD